MRLVLVPFVGVERCVRTQLVDDIGFLKLESEIAAVQELPPLAYNAQRRQYRAEKLLETLRDFHVERVLGITTRDIYFKPMNFVFGLADCPGRVALISTFRLQPDDDPPVFRQRLAKEAVHELGHTFGLAHCPDLRCVMHFSNTLQDTDYKGMRFCRLCQGTLSVRRRWLLRER